MNKQACSHRFTSVRLGAVWEGLTTIRQLENEGHDRSMRDQRKVACSAGLCVENECPVGLS